MAQGVSKKCFLKIPMKNESFLPFGVLEMLQTPFISEGQKKGKALENQAFSRALAEGVGFEPTCPEGKRFSRFLQSFGFTDISRNMVDLEL